MSKKTDKEQTKWKLPAHALVAGRLLIPVEDIILEGRKLDEIASLIWVPEGLEKNEKNARILRALDLYESLKPGDGAEGMLAAQMVGTHFAALECLRRAAIPNQTIEGRERALKQAQKLMALYTQQLAALNKHRGKGQQKVTVEHVHVAAGGQAIVGTVEAPKPKDTGPEALADRREIPMDAPPVGKATTSRRKHQP